MHKRYAPQRPKPDTETYIEKCTDRRQDGGHDERRQLLRPVSMLPPGYPVEPPPVAPGYAPAGYPPYPATPPGYGPPGYGAPPSYGPPPGYGPPLGYP
ncbi:hypothetical protein DSK22_05560, partial [Mycobacterium tuberculosis]